MNENNLSSDQIKAIAIDSFVLPYQQSLATFQSATPVVVSWSILVTVPRLIFPFVAVEPQITTNGKSGLKKKYLHYLLHYPYHPLFLSCLLINSIPCRPRYVAY